MDYVNHNSFQVPLNRGHCLIDDLPKVFAHIKLIHVNARDIRAGDKFAEIENFATLGSSDVVCVSETFLSSADAEFYNLPGFSHRYIVRKERSGGGVSMYIDNSFGILESTHFCSSDEAVQILRCKISRRATSCYVVALYSNNRSQHDCLLELLETAITKLSLPVIVLGDSNINTLVNDIVSTKYLSFLSTNALLPAIEGITRPESGTCLDHILLPLGHVIDAYSRTIETNTVSDHFPVWAAICLKTEAVVEPIVTSQQLQRRIFSSRNFYKFFSSLSVADFTAVIQAQCTDKALSILESILFSVYDTSFPVKAFRLAKSSANPLFPDILKRLRRKLDRLRRDYCRDKDNLLAKAYYYTELRAYRLKRKKLYADLMNDNISKKDTSSAWKFLKKAIGVDKSARAPSDLLMNGTLAKNDRLMAEGFADYFADIGETIVSKLTRQNLADVASLLPHRPLNVPFQFTNVTAHTLLSAAKRVKSNFGGPLHTIPSRILKQALPIILEPILHIFNLSIDTGIFPQKFKTATVIPLYKFKGSKSDPANYRPISLCLYLSKLFEKCISTQIYNFLSSVGFFARAQFGFLNNRSTDLAICELYNRITHLVSDGNAVLCAFLDVAKAFDSVSPKILDDILLALDFNPLCRKWLFSYLTERKIVVRVGQLVSSERVVKLGVPQGSSLGPLLFVVYMNVILLYIETRPNLGACCYADDLTVFMKMGRTSAESDLQIFKEELVLLKNTYNSVGLSLNISKTELVLFKNTHSRVALSSRQVNFNSTVVPFSDRARFLGVVFSKDLKWVDHFEEVGLKCYRIIAMLARLRRTGLLPNVLVYFYKALFIPVLCYGLVLWGSTFDTHLRRLEVLQHDAIRTLFGLPRQSSVSSYMRQYGLLTVKQLYRYKVSSLMFSQWAIGNSYYSSQYTRRLPPLYPLRNYSDRDIELFTERTEYCRRAPLYHHGKIWNDIPAVLRSAPSLRVFQRMLRELLLKELDTV